MFRCLRQNANINWIWNETVLIEANLPDGIATGRAVDDSGNVAAFTLTVEADLNYNQTEVVCLATVFVGSIPVTERSLPVNLTIQGETETNGNIASMCICS